MALADSGKAIGAVTRLLQDHLIRRGFDVSIGKPEDAANVNSNEKLNLFLYETAFDPQLRNLSLRDGEPPPLWLVLKFLLTAFDIGESSDTAAAHDLLGQGMAALHELGFLPLDSLVATDVRLALENNPEPLKLSFDESGADLLAKTMQGAEERYRLSVAFQVRPVMIVPASLPRGALLVGVDYSTSPETLIGREGVQVAVMPSMGARLDRVEPARFEAGATLTLYGEDLNPSNLEVLLGNIPLTVLERQPQRLVVSAEGSPGTPIASGTSLSAGEMPLVVRRRLSPTRTRSSNLLAARLLPTLDSAALVAGDLHLQGTLLGTDSDDLMVLFYRESDGVTVHLFDEVSTAVDQQSLVIAGAAAAVPAGSYRVILRVNNQQAKASPRVVVP
ncbi:Pvc16 family protein [Pseudomonas resinovorans]|uniref:Pvc16 family protein n=1 Tax=Metapseudomonas resinovorans TaxID=53412 RepID=UPI00237F946F|nr:Pvc16 family protein [Pseudomonas resinovorans]MDE3737767.1 Pvc16 family protein [Pseudomonas resinovorans]